MIEFLQAHWRDIIYIFIALVVVVFSLIKKPVASSFDAEVISDLCVYIIGLINKAEESGLSGDEKKSNVISSALKYVKHSFGRVLNDDEIARWSKRVSCLTEMILSTPQKKEGIKSEN